MSIPKEPRQLMINLMYLVLTALLALNVSAEVMNAFFTLDKGNQDSINTVNKQLDDTEKGLKSLLEDESKRKFKPIEPAVAEVRQTVSEVISQIDALRDELIDVAGNGDGEVNDEDYTESYGKVVPKGKKNKDITTRLLVTDGKGDQLKDDIIAAKDKLVSIYSGLLNDHGEAFGLKEAEIKQRIESIKNNLPLKIDDESWKESKDKNSWADFKFRQMPLAAVLPLLSQIQSDAKTSEATLVNQMAELAGGRIVEFDAFFPVVNAKKSYLIRGEPFEAEVSVGTYSTQISPDDITLTVNGSRLTVGDDGKAKYTASTSSLGTKTLNLTASVRNPLTGEVTEGDATFSYEVGESSVAVSADKMNVFYIGVQNPVSVSAAGVSSNDLRVSIQGGGGKIKKVSNSNYVVEVSQETQNCKVVVSGGGLSKSKTFRVKRIPDPKPQLGNQEDGNVKAGTFRAQGGVIALLDNFDFDARCDIVGYEFVYQPKGADVIPVTNRGGRYSDQASRLAQRAKIGDTYYMRNIRAKCPGDKVTRKIGSLVFSIR